MPVFDDGREGSEQLLPVSEFVERPAQFWLSSCPLSAIYWAPRSSSASSFR